MTSTPEFVEKEINALHKHLNRWKGKHDMQKHSKPSFIRKINKNVIQTQLTKMYE